ncbi:MAG: TraR/DksA C4-type zinc finger protein [bacterium]
MKAHYEQKLIDERKKLTEELNKIGRVDGDNGEWQAKSTDVDESEADPSDHADRFEDFEEKSSLVIPLTARLQEVEDALTRILENKFGRCAVCNNEIEKERLDANPAAETCIKHLK